MPTTTLRAIKRVRIQTRRIGHNVLWVRRTASTNDLAWEEVERGAGDGALVLAEEQTAGRGRFGRAWVCPSGRGILCSAVLAPEIAPEKGALLTVIGALAVRDTAASLAGVSATIRWPNDVMVGGRKVAGVLVESRAVPDRPAPVYVLGIGLNVSVREEEFPAEVRTQATSLEAASGRRIDRLIAARTLIEALDEWYVRLCAGRHDEISGAWRDASAVLRQRVAVRTADGEHEGTVEDLDPCEGIFLRLDRGGIRRFRGEHVERLRLL